MTGHRAKKGDRSGTDEVDQVLMRSLVLFELPESLRAVIVTGYRNSSGVRPKLIGHRGGLSREPHIELPDVVQAADRSERCWRSLRVEPHGPAKAVSQNCVSFDEDERTRSYVKTMAKYGVVRGRPRRGSRIGLTPMSSKQCSNQWVSHHHGARPRFSSIRQSPTTTRTHSHAGMTCTSPPAGSRS